MASTEVVINGRGYRIACDDGQESHLAALADIVDQRVRGLLKNAPSLTEMMAIVLSALMIADESHDLRGELRRVRQQPAAAPLAEDTEAAVAATLTHIAERIEAIAEYVEMR